ncbi:MAG: ApaLI family restriction endonuclease [Chloroflexi bacterium]|nr:ApaLI family restriction endonuclease [Chloroflexota bacterium]
MTIADEIRILATRYAEELKKQIAHRVEEMEHDDTSYYLIYTVLGVSNKEGKLIDVYQNKGRFLYNYAGAFSEEAAKLCFKYKFPAAAGLRIANTEGSRPKTFEIDCVIENDAIEIKWRDATTDGDHITKEHTRIKAISRAGYIPIRVMFYYPNRVQAMRIQEAIQAIYESLGGQYYQGDNAWKYVEAKTTVNLKGILQALAKEREGNKNGS